jgi:L-ascorbate metabolism protein UlaG (beta-lactamase superfamily)
MKLTKYAHACVTFTDAGQTLLVDPGTFTPNAAELLTTADAVLITHEHFDHFDQAALTAELDRRPGLKVFGPAGLADALGGRITPVQAGDSIEAAGFAATVYGEQHAPIHADFPVPANVGYLVEGRVFHPGDSYTVPGVEVETLLVPTSGPWTKFGETADFVLAVKPKRIIQIHELMLSELGQNSAAMFLGEKGPTGLPLENLAWGTSTEI